MMQVDTSEGMDSSLSEIEDLIIFSSEDLPFVNASSIGVVGCSGLPLSGDDSC